MNRKLIILGSARRGGNTKRAVDFLMEIGEYDVIDLLDYNIGYFDYKHQNREDDYLVLMRSITAKYDTFIFATPVYWYSMSARMKTFFDRMSDLLKIEKDLGRTLRGKSMGMLSSSGSDDRNENFTEPFVLTADYLGMKYLGDVHAYFETDGVLIKEVKERLLMFDEQVS